MMPSLQIRDLPEPIYQKLKEQAAKEFRSLSQQAITVLAKGLGVSKDSKSRRKEILEQISKNPVGPSGDTLPDPVAMIREDRER
ncbi:MAG: hypothetical protein JRH08_13450 [Deltaproteobacteria bacterium]|nr:hypothetical protein [Deltaproteobacteria bacterium]MBW2026742.1 hypothetical protein [Deltaproteobacteria bacterium]MBW2126658.1 hypothetical protein [Deltaproteobacteria bacterium]